MGLKKLNLNSLKFKKIKQKLIDYKSSKKEKDSQLRLSLEKRRRKELDRLVKEIDRKLYFQDPKHSKQPLTIIERNKQLIKEIKTEEFKNPILSLLSNAKKLNSIKKNQVLLRERYSANLLVMLLKEYSAHPQVANSIKESYVNFQNVLVEIANKNIDMTYDKAEFVIRNTNAFNKALLQTTSLLELSNRVEYFKKTFEKLSKSKDLKKSLESFYK
ncbi:hypothetical protein M0P25_02815 [archaeon]|nr:hypothetical protein [archaeon]MDD2477938.1 hypothetical protein [Candidatus ainarchaeum sp.]MDD3084834.1 hypothetical protein [Candidatus ainarchaeum sp.]MDD4221242.1 hypothetical protein [Candidatus ainarchaeum sp.]MDD4662749.1 hypothetical protein [Candidatus ainarchaeum sp.]